MFLFNDKQFKINYFFCPKYIKDKKEIMLTMAIRYQPDVELLEISCIYFGKLYEDLIILEKISNDNNKNTISILSEVRL